jgi:hypothetical protein
MRFWPLILCLLPVGILQAQVTKVDSLLAQTHTYDSILLKPEQRLDSIQHSFYQQSDSIKLAFKNKLSGIDATGASVQHKIDSLSSLQLPTEKYTHKLDSLNQERQKAVASLNEKVEGLKSKTTGRLKEMNLPPELNDKVTALTKNVDGFQLPVKDLNIPSLNMPDNPMKSLDGLNTSLKTPLGEVGNIDGLKNIQSGLGDVTKATGEFGHYQQDIQNITKGNLSEVKAIPQTLENKAGEVAGIKDIQQQASGALNPIKEMQGQIQNPDAMKDQALQQVQEVAVNHFAGKEEVLQQAMEKIAKYKQKYSSINSLSDITKKRPNEMHGKPLIERIVPGIYFQILKRGNELLVDFNPYVGYRFTGRITAGPGWNQRVSFDYPHGRATRVYGPRVYAEYKLPKGFSPRIEIEALNTSLPPRFSHTNTDPNARTWAWSYMVGIKKEYRFFKRIKGTTTIMGNLYDPHHRSPYGDRVVTRFGFEFPMKKKPKKQQ